MRSRSIRASLNRSLPTVRRPIATAPIATAPMASAPSAKEPSASAAPEPAPKPTAFSATDDGLAGSSCSLGGFGVSGIGGLRLEFGRLGFDQRDDVVEHGLAGHMVIGDAREIDH